MVAAGSGSGLVAAPPEGPAQPVDRIGSGANERREQPLDLVAGERDQPVRSGMAGMFCRTGDRQESVREHGQGDPARGEAAHLVLVQSRKTLPRLECLLNSPSRPGDMDQRGKGCRSGRGATVVGPFAGCTVAADQQLVMIRSGVCRPGPGSKGTASTTGQSSTWPLLQVAGLVDDETARSSCRCSTT